MFVLDPAFLATSVSLTPLALCEARLQNDRRFAWVVLVPRIVEAREIDDLSPADRARLIEAIALAGAAVRAVGQALTRPVEKLNIGLLGNVTPQLHAHVVGRRRDDAAWPGPVWGFGAPLAYGEADLAMATAAALGVLNRNSG
jgi:diadenosine tetraphosphate (Ap4A) HIT family hydrolase